MAASGSNVASSDITGDPTRKYGTPDPTDKNNWTCHFCDRVLKGGSYRVWMENCYCKIGFCVRLEKLLGNTGPPMGKRNRAAVVVLGDIGRSPRMQYHALSLARQALLDVDIVAYGGTVPHVALLEHQSVHIHEMPQWPKTPRSLPSILRPLFLVLKPIFQFLVLLWYLCVKIPAPDAFMVQNPPSVPTLVAVKWASWLRQSAFIVDWHNFGYTLLALSLERSSLFVTIYRWIEKHYGKMAHGSLCVTRAMQHELSLNWGIEATVLYDQPPEFFRPASLEEKHNLFCRISKSLNTPYGLQDCISNGEGSEDTVSNPF